MANRLIVHLIRHDKTQANIDRKYIGWTDEPIVDEAYDFSFNFVPEIVFGSDLIRCAQTAKKYFPTAEFKASADLRELDFGDFEMKNYADLQHNAQYRAWIDCPGNISPPNGESYQIFEKRIMERFQQIVQQAGEYTFVIHGGVMRVLLAHFGPVEQAFQQTVANHRTLHTLSWHSIEQLQGGARCKSFSEVPITGSSNL